MSRLAASADFSDLLQGVLPTPKIRSVSLKLSPLPPPVSNPHIDHKRETIIYEGRDGQRKFGARGIAGTSKDPRNLLVEVTVVLLDTINDNGSSKWFHDQDLMKYLRLQVIHSEDAQFSQALFNRDFVAIPQEVNKAKKMDGSIINRIIPLNDKIEDFYAKQNGEAEVREMVQKFSFAVETTTPEHLTYFANVYLDTEQLINDFGLDLPPNMLGQACSNTTAEAVYRNKSLVSAASVYFYKDTSTMYAGMPYAVGAGKYITSSRLNDNMVSADILTLLSAIKQDSRATKFNRNRLKLRRILENNTESKLLQLNKVLSEWTDRSNGKSGQMYKALKNKKKIYDAIIKSEPLLTRKQVSNPTLRDERTIQDLSNITLDVEDTNESEESVVDIRSRRSNATAEAAAENLKNALYFSNLSVGRDTNNNARMTFFFDWQKMIQKNTRYAGLLKNTNKEINDKLRSKVKLQGVRLIRERHDDSNTMFELDRRQLRDRSSIVQVIADAYEKDGIISGNRIENSPLRKKNVVIGAMKELKIDNLTDDNLRAFEAVDYNISSKTSGKFKYRVEFTIVDNIGGYLRLRAKELIRAKEALKQYYNISLMKCNYDTLSDRFTEFFISALYEKYAFPNPDTLLTMTPEETNALLSTSSPLEAPWMRPIAKYTEILNLFGNISDSDGEALAKKMYLKVEPSTGSPDGILEVIKQFEELETKIADLLGSSMTEMGNNASASSKVTAVLTDRISIKYQFNQEVDCSSLSSVKSRYLEYAKSTRTGLPYISVDDLRVRFTQEESKFFRNSPTSQESALADMGTYRYSYLSPSYLQVGGKNLSLLNRGQALYDAQQYKEMLFSITLLKSNPAARSLTMPVLNMPASDLQQSTAASAMTAGINMQAIGLLSRFGIAFKTAAPAKSTQQTITEPLQTVSEILGENTLLAINNAIKSASDEATQDEEQVTTKLNSEIAEADATLFASSLVSTLVNVGMNNFSGTRHRTLQAANFNPKVKQEIEFSRTLDFFNLTVPQNGVDSKIRSSNSVVSADSDSKVRKIPNQIKSIFLTKTGQATPVKDWFTLESDPMSDPELRPLFEILYFNLQQIEVLVDFGKSGTTDNKLLRSPKYVLLTPQLLARKGKLLCRLKKYRNDSLYIGQNETMDLPVVNEHFIIELSKSPNRQVNPVIKSNLTTDGSEYKLPNGTNYIGSYHIHKDGTVMTGADMGDGELVLTPLTGLTTTRARASAFAATNLLDAASSYEKTVMQGLVSNHYEQVSVASEYCYTAQTIASPGNVVTTETSTSIASAMGSPTSTTIVGGGY